MPALAVPVAVPELAIPEDGEHLEPVDSPRGDARRRRRRPAERLGLQPALTIEDGMEEIALRSDPEAVDPVLAPRHGGDARGWRWQAIREPDALDVRNRSALRSGRELGSDDRHDGRR